MFKVLTNTLNYDKCNRNYNKKIEELLKRPEGTTIKVCFLIRENQKWSYQSLYELFEKSERFEPVVLVSLLWLSHIGKDTTRNNLEENYNFFKERGMRVEYAYQDGEYLDLSEFSPDIVFYDQPWDLPIIHHPVRVSKYALTCYVPYGYSILRYKNDYTQDFHKLLYKMFLEHDYVKNLYESINKDNSKNCVVTGSPKLDKYKFPKSPPPCDISVFWKHPEKYKIIYAPHHSFENNGLKFATFKQNGQFILEYAKSHPETTWIFKPHPRFKYAVLKNNIMTEEEIEQYYQEWESIGKVCTSGDYIDIFKSSDLLLTDCCSFLAEYMPSKNPIIQIMNKEHMMFSEIGNLLLEGCYSVFENNEIEEMLNKLIYEKIDEKKEIREKVSNEIYDETVSNGLKIYNEIDKVLKEERKVSNIALLIAGGVGSRMKNAIPKQFMTVFDKPIIAYTMERFEKHPAIDAIAVVCLDGWHNILASYAKQYNITKLKYIAPAGSVGQESIKNGLMELQKYCSGDDIVLIHDGNRPMISKDIISECIAITQEKGNAIACIPCQEAILETVDGETSNCSLSRETLKRTQTPHGFRLKDLLAVHEEAQEKGIKNSVASCTLMIELGKTVHFSSGSEKNIKLTTQEDIDIFKALLKGEGNE